MICLIHLVYLYNIYVTDAYLYIYIDKYTYTYIFIEDSGIPQKEAKLIVVGGFGKVPEF